MKQLAIRRFRYVAYIEGISYVLLLFVAMPLKYFAGLPLAVRIVGMAHGVLFIAYVVTLALAASQVGWSVRKSALAFLASLVPFATFPLERRLRAEEAALGFTPSA
jgi:integral membrane protein